MADHIRVASPLNHIVEIRFTSEQMRVVERLAVKHDLNIIQLIRKAVLEEMDANQHLAALNAELLAALEGLVKTCEADGVIYRWTDLGLDLTEARAAINNAKGGRQ